MGLYLILENHHILAIKPFSRHLISLEQHSSMLVCNVSLNHGTLGSSGAVWEAWSCVLLVMKLKGWEPGVWEHLLPGQHVPGEPQALCQGEHPPQQGAGKLVTGEPLAESLCPSDGRFGWRGQDKAFPEWTAEAKLSESPEHRKAWGHVCLRKAQLLSKPLAGSRSRNRIALPSWGNIEKWRCCWKAHRSPGSETTDPCWAA